MGLMYMESGQSQQARAALKPALESFETTQARPWSERAQASLKRLADG